MKTIMDAPDDVLIEIFVILPNLMPILACVCRRFRRICAADNLVSLWTHVDLRFTARVSSFLYNRALQAVSNGHCLHLKLDRIHYIPEKDIPRLLASCVTLEAVIDSIGPTSHLTERDLSRPFPHLKRAVLRVHRTGSLIKLGSIQAPLLTELWSTDIIPMCTLTRLTTLDIHLEREGVLRMGDLIQHFTSSTALESFKLQDYSTEHAILAEAPTTPKTPQACNHLRTFTLFSNRRDYTKFIHWFLHTLTTDRLNTFLLDTPDASWATDIVNEGDSHSVYKKMSKALGWTIRGTHPVCHSIYILQQDDDSVGAYKMPVGVFKMEQEKRSTFEVVLHADYGEDIFVHLLGHMQPIATRNLTIVGLSQDYHIFVPPKVDKGATLSLHGRGVLYNLKQLEYDYVLPSVVRIHIPTVIDIPKYVTVFNPCASVIHVLSKDRLRTYLKEWLQGMFENVNVAFLALK
jgi:hypothetical protein